MHIQVIVNMAHNYPNTNMPAAAATAFGSQDQLPVTTAGYEHQTDFDFSDFPELSDWVDDQPFAVSGYLQSPNYVADDHVVFSSGTSRPHEGPSSRDSGSGRDKKEIKEKVAFKTKSEVEILDDGFKWRKYGKKMVKNSPNPRNYYRCSVEGCPVKKRVERDKEDPRYVVTTYEGIHNHQGPSQI